MTSQVTYGTLQGSSHTEVHAKVNSIMEVAMRQVEGRQRQLVARAGIVLALVSLIGLGGCFSVSKRALANGSGLTYDSGLYGGGGVIGNNSFSAQRQRQSMLNAAAFHRLQAAPPYTWNFRSR